MDNKNIVEYPSYFDQAKYSISAGLRTYTSIAIVLFTVFASFNVLMEYAHDRESDKLLYAISIFLDIVITNVLVFWVGMIIVGLVFSLNIKRENSLKIIILSFIVSLLIILAGDYLLFISWYGKSYYYYSFFEFIFLFDPSAPLEIFFAPFFIPNIINLMIFTYAGWKIAFLKKTQIKRTVSWRLALLAVFILFLTIPLAIFLLIDEQLVIYAFSIAFIISCLILVRLLSAFLIQAVYTYQKSLSNLAAGFFGFIIGIAFVYLINHILWITIYPPDLPQRYQWLNFPSFNEFVLGRKIFLIPDFLCVLVSSFQGWKTNKSINSIAIFPKE